MKKQILSIVCVIGLFAFANASNDKVITINDLPVKAQNFISEYFDGQQVLLVQKDMGYRPDYEVRFTSGAEVDFDSKGEWLEVKNPSGVNMILVPQKIVAEVLRLYPNTKIIEIDRKDKKHYEIRLNNGFDIKFSKQTFKLIEVDD